MSLDLFLSALDAGQVYAKSQYYLVYRPYSLSLCIFWLCCHLLGNSGIIAISLSLRSRPGVRKKPISPTSLQAVLIEPAGAGAEITRPAMMRTIINNSSEDENARTWERGSCQRQQQQQQAAIRLRAAHNHSPITGRWESSSAAQNNKRQFSRSVLIRPDIQWPTSEQCTTPRLCSRCQGCEICPMDLTSPPPPPFSLSD